MASIISKVGSQLVLTLSGEHYIAVPTTTDTWILNYAESGPDPGPSSGNFAWPFNPNTTVTSEYGPRDGKIHQGIDFGTGGVALGSPVLASNSGIRHANGSSNFGNHVIIDHGVIDNKQIYTLYGHMQAPSAIPIGGAITKGQVIGGVNNTGSSRGNHLHWETHVATIGGAPRWSNPGTHVNPRTFMAQYGETTYTNWVTQRTNLFTDPRGTSLNAAVWGSTGGTTNSLSLVNNMPGDVPTAVRSTSLVSGNQRIIDFKIGTVMLPSTQYRFFISLRASVAYNNVTISMRPDVTVGSPTVIIYVANIPAGTSAIDITGTSVSNATTTNAGITFTGIPPAGNPTLDITKVLIAKMPDSGIYYDGNLSDLELTRYEWVGGANASQSILQTRTKVPVIPPIVMD